MTWLNNRKALLWLVPILTTVHNVEEVLFMPFVIEKRNSSVPTILSRLLPPITYGQFLLAVFIMTAIPYLVAWFSDMDRERSVGITLLICLQVMMLINVFAHISIALMMRGYAPGLITAVAIQLPYSIFMLSRALRDGWLSRSVLVQLGFIGLLLNLLVLPGIVILSGRIVHRF